MTLEKHSTHNKNNYLRKDRHLTASDTQFYNPENYTPLQFSTEKHLGVDRPSKTAITKTITKC